MDGEEKKADAGKVEEKQELSEDFKKLDAEIYEKRKKEFEEIEQRLDKKTKEFREAVDEYRKEGKGFAIQQAQQKPETEKEYAERVLRGEVKK